MQWEYAEVQEGGLGLRGRRRFLLGLGGRMQLCVGTAAADGGGQHGWWFVAGQGWGKVRWDCLYLHPPRGSRS